MNPSVPLAEVCTVTMGQAPPGASYNDIGNGFALVAGAGDFGDLFPAPKKYTTSPTRLTQIDDIVLCIRATIGDLNWSDREYCLGRGVAGLRTDQSKLDRRYLWHFIRANQQQLESKGTGSTFKQVSRRHIEEWKIPLPPLKEQKRIAAILDEADAIRRKRQQTIELTDQFLRSVFLDMFGDPVKNPKRWPNCKLVDLGSLDRGKSKHRPRNDPVLLGGKYPLIQTGDVANSDDYIRRYSATYSETGLSQSRLWPAGTLCITIAANIAKTGILTFEGCFPDSVVGFTANEATTSEYVQWWLSFLQRTLEKTAPESAQKNINLRILRALDVPVPPIGLQSQFTRIVDSVEHLRENLRASRENADALFDSFAQRAFHSDLADWEAA